MYDDLQLELTSTVDQAAEELRRALFTGQIEPGTPLREVALADAMGVARSTIREALGTLVAEGIVVRVPNKGVAVKELSATDVHDVSVARHALETAGVRRWDRATDDHRQQVRDAFDRYCEMAADDPIDSAALTEAHLQIHRALVGLTGSDRLLAAHDSLAGEIRLGLAHLDRTRRNLNEQIGDHRGLVDMLEAGDHDAALTELDNHLASAEESLLAATGNTPSP